MSVCNDSSVIDVMLSLVGCKRKAVYHGARVNGLRTAFMRFIKSGSVVISRWGAMRAVGPKVSACQS